MSEGTRFDLFRCTECDWVRHVNEDADVGYAHAHAEKHTSAWGLPAWMLPCANPPKLDQYIERVTVEVVRECQTLPNQGGDGR